jgi:uncharacterized membrane protein YfcA
MLEASVIFAAGVWAGTINVIVGSGTLITFPTLLLFGYPAITANVSNNIGLVAGGLSGVHGYRAEALRHRSLLVRLAPASVLGALTGALLLLVLPAEAFQAVVPVLISLGLVMVVVGPAMQRRTARRHAQLEAAPTRSRWALPAGVYVLGIYGGYFGAAQGILLVGLMGVLLTIGLQDINGIKNVLATIVNAVAAVTFMVVAWDHIDWLVVGLIGAGSLIGGQLGARIGRRLRPEVLRAVILIIGILALVKIVFVD